MSKILQLKIILEDTIPAVWRKILVKDSITFNKLHNIMQIVMGWQDYHLHEFHIDESRIGIPDEDDEFEVINDKKVKLNQFLSEKKKIKYIYDFGDSWLHNIIVEKILDEDEKTKLLMCVGGERACPPEDCGGTFGYRKILEASEDKNSIDYKKIKNWLGRDFNPEEFDLNKINKDLFKLKL